MNSFTYVVASIDGDYANLKRTDTDSEDLKLVARALLPEEITEGTCLKYEFLQYKILQDTPGQGGFTLVELLVVLAIGLALLALLIPQLLNYVEKTKVRADLTLCETIQSVMTTELVNPEVLADPASVEEIDSLLGKTTELSMLTQETKLNQQLAQDLGYTSVSEMTDKIDLSLKSKRKDKEQNATICFTVTESDSGLRSVTVQTQGLQAQITAN